MEDQQIKEATQEAVDTAADAVQETAKAVDNAVETAATNRHVAGEAAAAVEEVGDENTIDTIISCMGESLSKLG